MLGDRFQDDGQATLTLTQEQLKTRDLVLHKLHSGVYPTETVPCLCGQHNFDELARKDRYGLPVITVICRDCGQALTNPRMTQAAYESFYQHEYRWLYVGEVKATERFFAAQYSHGQRIYQYVYEQGVKCQNVLEIGCGAGGILQAFEDEGINSVGVDLGNEYLDFGKSHGLTLFNMSSQQLLESHSNSFDLIILSHVFEHFLDIEKELSAVITLLKSDGVLYIEVPGIKNLRATYECDFLRYLQNAHTYHFSLGTLQNAVVEHGFKMFAGDESVKALFKSNQIKQVNTRSNEYYSIRDFLLDLELNRQDYLKSLSVAKLQKKQSAFSMVDQNISHFPNGSVCIYGTGQHTLNLLDQLTNRAKILGLLDNDEKKIGTYVGAFEVLKLSDIQQQVKAIIISSSTFQSEIYFRLRHLRSQGIELIKIY
ncbi:methyltransferase domain-containing protein [Neptunicella sp. SCSIO 80796]|uniref:class I SAM-dependent methyltransferase n=1 Tax=Neptunicella plasticusilytica TaxID=3117012 RepID=UPI003A4E416C